METLIDAPVEPQVLGPTLPHQLVELQAAPIAAAADAEAGNLIHVIAAAARDPSVDIDKMERLWTMYERLKNRASEEAFNAAMNKAQSEMGRVAADATNPQTRSLYATYGKLDAMVRPVYTRNGFSVSFDEGEGAPEGHLRMLAYVSHSAGHTRKYKADIPNDGKGAKGGDVMTKTHATGAGKSYGKRYMLKDIFNIAIGEEDNDGNGEDDKGHEVDTTELLIAQVKKTTTDEDAAAHWKANNKPMLTWPKAYERYKAAVVAHRTALKGAAK